MSDSRRASVFAILAILGLYLLTTAIVHPLGNFPLNDDWTYARAVKTYVETGGVHYSSWLQATFLAQLYYGALFVKVFGFSHVILRVSTVILGAATLILFFGMLRAAGITVTRSTLGCVLLLSTPFFLGNCFTFMTEIPYLFALLAAVLLYTLSCERENLWMAFAAGVAASVAVLIRQTGILLPLAAAAIFMWDKKQWKHARTSLLVFSLLPAISLAGFEIWFHYAHGLPPKIWQARHLAGLTLLGRHLLEIPIVSLCYLGLLLLPITLAFGLAWLKAKRTREASVVGMCALLVLLAYAVIMGAKGIWMPYKGNTWFDLQTFGQGPYTLKDVSILFHTDAVSCGRLIFYVATILSILLGGAVAALLWNAWPERHEAPLIVKLSAVAGLLHMAFFVFMDYYIDRNLLPVFPFAILVLLFSVRKISPRPVLVGGCSLLLYGVTVAGVYQYHRWNEARWRALDYLMEEVDASPNEIDGGFEFNGWMLFDDYFPPPKGDNSWWWVRDDKYMVTFSVLPGYKVLRRFPFKSPIPWVAHEVLALERRP